MLSIIEQSAKYGHKTAIVSKGVDYSYIDLFMAARSFAADLLNGDEDLYEARVGCMVSAGFEYVQVQWATWLAGGVSVPFCLSFSLPSLQTLINDSNATIIIVSPEYEQLIGEHCKDHHIRLIVMNDILIFNEAKLPQIVLSRRAMILYTSDPTTKPKGIVFTHQNIEIQIKTLAKEWEWTSEDYILSMLPMHHINGIINVVSCALHVGAVCEFMPFSLDNIFNTFLQQKQTLFMADDKLYHEMIAHYDTLPAIKQLAHSDCMKKMRLMICLSAELPVSAIEKWENISGHTLLESYGMNEVGMAISKPLNVELKPGYVGLPLSSLEIRLVNENFVAVEKGQPGQIIVKGKTVFKEYWNKSTETESSFIDGEWFKTGDIAIIENGYYRILGRLSDDIIKLGLEEISALEIEEIP